VVKKDLVAAKLAELAQRVARVAAKLPSSPIELEGDADALDIVSFNLMLAVQLCADIASHIVSDEGLVPARSLAEGFGRLAEHGILTSQTAEQLKRAVGLRNVVAHGYGRVDSAAVFAAGRGGLDDLRAFSREVSAWLATRPG
jgi:uncharacterized protein YutE (UPF0331/DUF86 family)